MIEIVKIGEDALHDSSFEVDRPHGFPEYLFLLTKTKGRFLVDGVWVEYPAGCAVLFKPYQFQRYEACGDSYSDSWMHFTTSHPLLDEHFPYGIPLVLNDFSSFNQLFHILCTQFYGATRHRDSIITELTESILHMLEDELQLRNYPDIYYSLVSLRKEIYYDPSAKWSIPLIAERLNISPGYLHALYQEYFNTTCMNDVISSRVKYACDLLVSCNLSVAEIGEKCGYSNTEHFIRQFKTNLHLTPGQYRKKNALTR